MKRMKNISDKDYWKKSMIEWFKTVNSMKKIGSPKNRIAYAKGKYKRAKDNFEDLK